MYGRSTTSWDGCPGSAGSGSTVGSSTGAGACGSAGASVAVHPSSIDYQWQSLGERHFGFIAVFSHILDLGGSFSDPADYDAIRAGARPLYLLVGLGA